MTVLTFFQGWPFTSLLLIVQKWVEGRILLKNKRNIIITVYKNVGLVMPEGGVLTPLCARKVYRKSIHIFRKGLSYIYSQKRVVAKGKPSISGRGISKSRQRWDSQDRFPLAISRNFGHVDINSAVVLGLRYHILENILC